MKPAAKLVLSRVSVVVAISALGVCVLAVGLWRTAEAQAAGWTAPQLIFEGRGATNAPTLVADVYGQVHAFWIFQADQQGDQPRQQIYYTRLDRPTWPVNDIFISASSPPYLKATMGRNGLAVLWGGSSFASSSISPAATALNWAGPVSLDTSYAESGLSAGPDGAVWRIYGATATNEVFVQRLNPDTRAWEASLLVSDPVNTNAAPDAARLAVSTDGTLHAVWAEYQLPNGWPPIGLYYAQSTNGGKTWSRQHKIAGANLNQPNVVAGPEQAVYITWTGTAGSGLKYFQESLDGGQTWQTPVVVMAQPGGGSEGAPSLAVDSAGNLHMVFSHNGCVWHASRQNNVWSAPECISTGVPANSQIEFPAMALGLGNQIHVLFWTDRRQLWYTTRVVSVPAQAPQPTPTLVVPTATTIAPTAVLVPSQTPLPDFGPPPSPEQASQPGYLALAAGVVPVVMLVMVVAVFRRRRH